MKPFESVGIWFLPDAPDRQVPGVLSFSSNERLELKLSGAFRDQWPQTSPLTYDVIHGVINEGPYGRFVSLFHCFSKSLRVGMPGIALETIQSDYGFAGRHFVDSDNRTFQKVTFSLSQLGEWIAASGFSMRHAPKSDGDNAGMDISYRFPPTHSCHAGGAKISTSYTFSTTSKQLPREVSIQEFPQFVVEEFGEATEWEITSRFFDPLMNLLLFASGARSELQSFEVSWHIDGQDELAEATFLFSPPRSEREPPEPLAGFQFLFTLRDVAHRFESFMQSWFAFQNKHEDFSTFLFSYDYSKHQFLETRFLFLMLAVQCFIRDDLGDSKVVDDIESVRAGMLSQLPLSKQAQSHLMIPSAIDLAFPTLLNEFFSRRWSLLEKVVGTTREHFVETLIAKWHHVVHRGDKQPNLVGGARLYWLTERLSSCMKLSILGELGFSSEEIISLRDNYQLFNYLATIGSPWDQSPE